MFRWSIFLGVLVWLMSAQVQADEALLKKPEVQAFVKQLVSTHHFKKNELTKWLKEAKYQPKIIQSMNRPYEKKSWDVYKNLFLTPYRLQKGIEFWQANRQTLQKAEEKYGVDAQVIVAILGVETLYGERQGTYRVLDALSTLAFYYPKRAPFFKKELKEYFLLCREQKLAVDKLKGSYAGAIGKSQFMPSSYRYYAVDFSGNGHSDLVASNADAIGSIANYLHRHGWAKKADVVEPLASDIQIPKNIKTNTRKANYAYHDLLKKGVKPARALANPPQKAGIIALNNQLEDEYWVAYPNFYVITRYNTSPQYALVVYLLSQQLQNHWAAVYKTITNAYA